MSATHNSRWFLLALPASLVVCFAVAFAADEDFATMVKRLVQEKPKFAQRQKDLLAERYDLGDRRDAMDIFVGELVLETGDGLLFVNRLERWFHNLDSSIC